MAEVVARNITTRRHDPRKATFKGADMSTKLKLLGIHVASFGDCFAADDTCQPLVYRDPFSGVYKKYLFTKDGKKLLGGMMIGDTNDYAKLLGMVKAGKRLQTPPSELILGIKGTKEEQHGGADTLPDDTQICSCNNVTKGTIRKIIRSKKCENVNQVKCFSKAGTGCGGCMPQVQEVTSRQCGKRRTPSHYVYVHHRSLKQNSSHLVKPSAILYAAISSTAVPNSLLLARSSN